MHYNFTTNEGTEQGYIGVSRNRDGKELPLVRKVANFAPHSHLKLPFLHLRIIQIHSVYPVIRLQIKHQYVKHCLQT